MQLILLLRGPGQNELHRVYSPFAEVQDNERLGSPDFLIQDTEFPGKCLLAGNICTENICTWC